jgi:putative MATE family efflux protein
MKDLTQGSVVGWMLALAVPTAAGMTFQTLYYLVDLYFVAQLGDGAVAGMSAAGNATLIVLALTQVLAVGTTALIAQAVGRKDRADANHVFNQAMALSAALGAVALLSIFLLGPGYMSSVAADPTSAGSGATYLYWYAPGLALQFAVATLAAGLRGTGIVQFGMLAQMVGVLLNVVLAPILIAGWLTGHAFGVAGAGLASSIAVAVATVMLWLYFRNHERYVSVQPAEWRPRLVHWRRILGIGLPAGGEFVISFLLAYVTYLAIARFGVDAQAGFAIGARLTYSITLPVVALSVAAGSIAGQNFGAGNQGRVRETFRHCLTLCAIVMASLTLVACWRPDLIVAVFATDAGATAVGTQFLRIVSFSFVAHGIVSACASIFQGTGNTLPALATSVGRLILFAALVLWMSTRPDFRIEHVWYVTVATVVGQACASLWLVQSEIGRRLAPRDATLAA